ncbi:MAG TPA: rod shape-determining protein MreD [Spirochaetota bacterium]|nr:rod shape-determining protein MreD [Spirochaetota bacterium]HNT11825.1 rod shape-determining protein MreD [Spirochaetota bacterium]HNV48711.1 rod shape-determining protein MreD [Spirochaetota bacterium]HOS38553.1 rod shape-determining protein MreD [Spirochaetota bacterium]HPU87572.1 rod shape-determining protein MreD [Spirochaetota bacterium]
MIFTYLITAGLIIASLVIQGHPSFDVLRIAGVKPDLLFIIVIYFGYSFGSFYGEVTGFVGGLLHDAISNSPIGFLAFSKMALGFVVGMFGRAVFKENILTVLLLLFIASLAKGVLSLFLAFVFHQAAVSDILSIIIPEAFYNAILAPPLFFLLDRLFEHELSREGY